jgi:transposase
MNEKRKRPRYTKEFKQDAVQLVIEQGYSGPEAARRLGIPSSNVTRWVGQYRQDQQDPGEGGSSRRELETENRRLKKENKRLQMEREILKKATAFFAKESH